MQNKFILHIIILSLFSLSVVITSANITEDIRSNYTYQDSLAVSAILDSCWENRTVHPSLALKYGKDALELIEAKEITPLKSKTLNYIGVIYRKLGNLEKSYDYFKFALNLAKVLKDSTQIGYTYNNLGDYYFAKASYSLALENVLSAYQIFEKKHNQMGMAYSLNYMGEIYIRHKDYDKALNYLELAASMRFEINDLRGYSNSVTNIGQIYFMLDNLKEAQI